MGQVDTNGKHGLFLLGMGPNTRIFENRPNIRIAKSYSIYGGKISYNWKKKSYPKLFKECPGKIFDLRKIDHRGNTSTVCV